MSDEADDLARPLMVGDLRKALAEANDEDMVAVMVLGQEERAVAAAFVSILIPWAHDCTDAPDEHRPGQDCPTVSAFEIHAEPISEFRDVQ